MRICILVTGEMPASVQARHGPYAGIFQRWLSGYLPDAGFTACAVHAGEALPDLAELDALLVTGSPHGVYEDLPWMGPLKALLRQAATRRIPQIGVCFGHQIMADAFGGRVEKSTWGWNVGRIEYRLTEAAQADFGGKASIGALAMHQDQVVVSPPSARVLATHERAPLAALAYEFPALSVQFHPEFSKAFFADLVEARDEHSVPRAVLPDVREVHGYQLDHDDVAAMFARFYRSHAAAGSAGQCRAEPFGEVRDSCETG